MPRLVTSGRTVSYEEAGAGPVALLLHGSPGNVKAWARVGERLADRYRVIAPDLPGYGETTPQSTPGGPTVGYAAELIEALIREVGAPAVVAGHSYGGVVALAVALRGRVSIGALALFEPVAVPVLAMAGETETFAAAKRPSTTTSQASRAATSAPSRRWWTSGSAGGVRADAGVRDGVPAPVHGRERRGRARHLGTTPFP